MARILITGGAGFIGSNLANRLLYEGHEVTIFDNLSRFGCDFNLAWLRKIYGHTAFRLVIANLTDFKALLQAAKRAERIYHLAGQVAVTTSIQNPRRDFEDNTLGTFNALEAARLVGNDPIFIYASTNKVYGDLKEIPTIEEATRYRYVNPAFGVSETQPLDFRSPYGCSKGAGDQYTTDYARIYGLRTVVMRQSCIYGYRQFGIEDQGWVAWFIVAGLQEHPLTIYGNGKQVRDVLFIEDLLDVYEAAVHHIGTAAGQTYNIGGGMQRTVSVWAELGPMLEALLGRPFSVTYAAWRTGDQRIYVSDIRKAERELDWRPRVSIREGVARLFEWVCNNRALFEHP